MRKLFFIIPFITLLSSCQKPYEKAIDKYIHDNFNDPESYECIEISEPKKITVLDYCVLEVKERGKKEGWTSDSILTKIGELRPFLEEKGNDPDKVLLLYVDHTYRANNKVGAKTLYKEEWYLSDDMTEVTSIEPK